MMVVGVLYLLFEKTILSTHGVNDEQSSTLSRASKCIIGAQIGLVVMAMVVTNSSVASLQAKKGLPLGNQVVGWMVLGKFLLETGFPIIDMKGSIFAYGPVPSWLLSE